MEFDLINLIFPPVESKFGQKKKIASCSVSAAAGNPTTSVLTDVATPVPAAAVRQ